MRALVLRKTDKKYLVALWPTAAIWDPVARTEVVPPTLNLNVRFGEPVTSASVYRPVVSSAAQSTAATPTSVPVSLSDEPVVLEVTTP